MRVGGGQVGGANRCPAGASRTGRTGTGERVTSDAIHGYEALAAPGRTVAVDRETAMFRRRSLQPSRRAVLHVQAAGDPPVPADLAAWYTERAFHFYAAGLRLPSQAAVGGSPKSRHLAAAFADLDAARAQLRDAEGMATVIVTATGRGAIAAAQWQVARSSAADALILYAPVLPPGTRLSLDVGCPVLVLVESGQQAPVPAGRRWATRRQRRPAGPGRSGLTLGGHVTWLRLPAAQGETERAGRQQYFYEIGRWLGAYMYGSTRDQLL